METQAQAKGQFLLVKGKLESGNEGCRKTAGVQGMTFPCLDFLTLQLRPFQVILVRALLGSEPCCCTRNAAGAREGQTQPELTQG